MIEPDTLVSFRGTRDKETGKMVSVSPYGRDIFLAKVESYVFGMVCLKWDNGGPVGIPFVESHLKKVEI